MSGLEDSVYLTTMSSLKSSLTVAEGISSTQSPVPDFMYLAPDIRYLVHINFTLLLVTLYICFLTLELVHTRHATCLKNILFKWSKVPFFR